MKLKTAIKLLTLPCLNSTIKVKAQFHRLGFKFLYSGSYKLVYRHPDIPDVVFKLWKDVNHKDVRDYKKLLRKLPVNIRPLVLLPIFECKFFFVQERMNSVGGSNTKAEKCLEKLWGENGVASYPDWFDINKRNVRFHNGQIRIIDSCEGLCW